MTFFNKLFRRRGKTHRWGLDSTILKAYLISTDTSTINEEINNITNYILPLFRIPSYPDGALNEIVFEIGNNPPNPKDGKIISEWVDFGPFNVVKRDTSTGKIIYAEIKYNSSTLPSARKRITLHEFGTTLTDAGRADDLPSIFNVGPPSNINDFTEFDRKAILFLYSRPPGSRFPDKDDMDFFRDKILIGSMSTIKTKNFEYRISNK